MRSHKSANRVLIADDDPVVRRWIESILEADGYTVVSMDDGRNAFRTLRSDAEFAAAVIDMSMPYLQGSDLIRYMRTEKRLMKIPVMLITAETDIGRLATFFQAGATVVLPKPFSRHRLYQSLRMLLSGSFAVKNPGKSSELPTATRNYATAAPQEVPTVAAVIDRDEYEATINGIVDLSVINELGDCRENGKPNLVVELIDLYLTNTEHQIAEIAVAVEEGNRDGLRRAAHALKGSSLTMGARSIGNLCESLERAQVGSQQVDELLAKIREEFVATTKIFHTERRRRLVPVAA